MKASEAREKLDTELAKDAVKRFFPLINQAILKKQAEIYIKKDDIKEKELTVLCKEYGYKYRIDQQEGEGEYDRSGKIDGYWLCW